ncbi:MAG: hypothetical protein ACRDSR_04850 [Pseudonocardiaceae bacterium]
MSRAHAAAAGATFTPMSTPSHARAVLMPQRGLAPGFVSVVAAAPTGSFDEVRAVSLRVGALPRFPDQRAEVQSETLRGPSTG